MKNSTVIITGHSQGLGAALATELLRAGAHVIGISRNKNPELQAQYREHLIQIPLDLSETMALQHWLATEADWTTWCANKQTLWLFNNAGTISPSLLLGKQEHNAIVKAVALNICAPLMLANAVAAQRSPLLDCCIVHISSGAAQKPYPGWSVYGACKAALDQHARSAHAEHNGVEIVSIAPGVVDTQMQAQLRNNTAFPAHERFIDLHSHQQLQTPTDTAQRIVAYCRSAHFAKQPVVDIRNLP